MIDYQTAKSIALKVNGEINTVREFNAAYDFYDGNDNEERTPDNHVVVLKSTGKIVNLTTFFCNHLPHDTPKIINF